MKRLVLIDSHAIIHRAFHALPTLTAPDGAPTNAVYGFASILLKILKDLKPDYAVAAFDHEGPTFRHLAFESYKAHREKAPDELYRQIPLVKELLQAFGIPVIEKPGYEADDLIGTVANLVRHRHPHAEIIIVTGDLDALQLVDEKTKVFTMKKGVSDTILYDAEAVKARYGLKPEQLIDFKGLCGDPSDNIPGVKGVGEKTAAELLKAWGSIEEVYRALAAGQLKTRPSVEIALKNHEADALFSKGLAAINRHVPIDFMVAQAKLRKTSESKEKIRAVFERLGFFSLLRRWDESGAKANVRAQTSLLESEPSKSGIRLIKAKSFDDVKGKRDYALINDLAGNTIFAASSADEIYQIVISKETPRALTKWAESKKALYVFDFKILMGLGLLLDTRKARDLKIMWWLLEPGRKSYEPEALVVKELKRERPENPVELARAIFEVAPRLEKRLSGEGLLKIYSEIEAPLIPILCEMEQVGIKLNPKPLLSLSKKMSAELAEVEKKIYDAAGGRFNIASPRQLGEVLFEKLNIAPQGVRRTEKLNTLSTRESELLKLKDRHPVIADILRWREIAKIKSTYIDTLPEMIDARGRLHSTWNQTGTATGRLSSQNPNLQNIPIKGKFGPEIRKAFIAESGYHLAAFDYSQLELRIAAELGSDEKMIEAFDRGLDIHTMTASEISGTPLEDVTAELRRQAKTLNFGILYGMGSRALGEAANISRDEARVFIEEYFRKFKGIADFIARTKDFARTHGYTQTVFGRKRFFPDIASTNFRIQREVERQAVNHPTQGTAADIMKKAMIGVHDFIKNRALGDKVRMLLQIHDELLFEVDDNVAGDVLEEIKKIMEEVWRGRVKMKVEVSVGQNWSELK